VRYLSLSAEQTDRLAELLAGRPASAGLLIEPRGSDWHVVFATLADRESYIITSSGTAYPREAR
jgi:hypothetical protein